MCMEMKDSWWNARDTDREGTPAAYILGTHVIIYLHIGRCLSVTSTSSCVPVSVCMCVPVTRAAEFMLITAETLATLAGWREAIIIMRVHISIFSMKNWQANLACIH